MTSAAVVAIRGLLAGVPAAAEISRTMVDSYFKIHASLAWPEG
jgi:hypothetical protein